SQTGSSRQRAGMVTCPMWTMTGRAEAAIIRSVLRVLPGLKVAPLLGSSKFQRIYIAPQLTISPGGGSFIVRFVVLLAAPMPRGVARPLVNFKSHDLKDLFCTGAEVLGNSSTLIIEA